MIKVSVLTPIYNTNLQHLKDMIESILNQTYKDFELILLNDSPWNKELESVVKSYKDERIKYYTNEENIGISESRNKLFDLAQGEYIAIFDHDDISIPERLEKEVKVLDENPAIGVVSANFRIMSNNHVTHHPSSNLEIKKNLISGRCALAHSAAMIRKKVMLDYNIRWESQYSPCEDYMLWARLLDKTIFFNIKEPLVIYRDHENNTTHNQQEILKDKSLLINNMLIKNHPLYANPDTWYMLFGVLPFLYKKTKGDKVKYLLFGVLPILTTKK